MITYVLVQDDPPNEPVNRWFLFNKDPAMLVGRITNPSRAKIVTLDVEPGTKADILMKMAEVKIDLGKFVAPGV